MSRKISLKQFLMRSGKFRKAEDCIDSIRRKAVTVEGKIVENPNHFFNPKALVKFNDEIIRTNRKLYFILNKPAGYTCQKTDTEKNIYELLNNLDLSKEEKNSLFCVGRLDKETEGLLIITNDGKFADFVLQSESGIEKEYHVTLRDDIKKEDFKKLREGIIISNEDDKTCKTKPVKIEKINDKTLIIKITEGKKRQIRKMFEALGNEVTHLKRTAIGGLALGSLQEGELKIVPRDEIIPRTRQN